MISRLSLGLPFYVSVQLFKCISGKNSRILLYFIGDERLWDNGLHGVPVLVRMLEIRARKSDSHNGELKWRVERVGERLISVLLNLTRNWIFFTINRLSDRRPARLPL